MSRTVALVVTALAFPLAASADPPTADGRIQTEQANIEILGKPVRVGEKVELPEGFIRVEEAGPEDGEIGSFAVVSVDAFRASVPSPQLAAAASDPAVAAPGGSSCRSERAAYLAELWHESGVDVSDPVALLEGLEAGAAGPATGYYWFALATDAFRPLAWSSELRARADRLARCVNGL